MKTKAIFLFGLFLGVHLPAAEVTVHAAASLTDVMKEIGGTYEEEGGDKVQLNFGASSMLARQIEEGAPGDLFLSADEAKMDELEQKGLLITGTRRRLISNLLVMVIPADATTAPKSVSDLMKPEYRKIAMGEPRTVPAGIYAREYLEELGLWTKIEGKVVPTASVRAVLAAVESGNVEAGFVYKTDALISQRVRIAFEISIQEGPKIFYPIAVLKSSRQPERARKFAEYLASPVARRIFERFGFIVVPPISP